MLFVFVFMERHRFLVVVVFFFMERHRFLLLKEMLETHEE